MTERIHVTKENAGIAFVSGILIGSGVIFPPAAGLGVAIGAVGLARERKHQRDAQMKDVQQYVNSNFKKVVVKNPYSDKDEFRRRAFKDILGVVVTGKKMDNDDQL